MSDQIRPPPSSPTRRPLPNTTKHHPQTPFQPNGDALSGSALPSPRKRAAMLAARPGRRRASEAVRLRHSVHPLSAIYARTTVAAPRPPPSPQPRPPPAQPRAIAIPARRRRARTSSRGSPCPRVTIHAHVRPHNVAAHSPRSHTQQGGPYDPPAKPRIHCPPAVRCACTPPPRYRARP